MHNVKLLNDNAMTPSTSSQAARRHNQKESSHRQNSIDADEMDLALSLAFPSNMDNMKKYTDDIWNKTISSDCDQPVQSNIWEKQPATQTPMPSTSSHGPCSPPKNHFYSEDIWSSMSGGNIFFPTSAPSTSSISKQLSAEVRHRKKISESRPSISEFDDDFNNMKQRLSLSSLRTSLCRQKAVENLNNGNSAHTQQRSSSALYTDNDFLQVDI